MRLNRAALLVTVLVLALGSFAPAGAGQSRAIAAYRLYHPQFLKAVSGPSSILDLQNLSDSFAAFTAEFYDATGRVQALQDGEIQPRGAYRLAASDVSGLPEGAYALVVSASQSLESLVRTQMPGAPESLTAYRGQPDGSTVLRFGPVYNDRDNLRTSITLLNIDDIPASATVTYISSAGTPIMTTSNTIPPRGFATPSNAWLPAGFEGWAYVTATEQVVGIVEVFDAVANTMREVRGPAGQAGGTASAATRQPGPVQPLTDRIPIAAEACVARALRHADQRTGPRSTRLLIGNNGNMLGIEQVTLYNAAGGQVWTTMFNLGAGAVSTLDLGVQAVLADGAWRACVLSDQPVVLDELTSLDSAGAGETAYYAKATAEGGAYYLYAPRLVDDDTGHSVLTLQNAGDGPVTLTVRMRNMGGAVAYDATVNLAVAGWKTYNLAKLPEIGAAFAGTAEVVSTGPLTAVVDELGPRPAAVKDLAAVPDKSARSAPALALAWSPVTADTRGRSIKPVTYNIYRATDAPYFLPPVNAEPYGKAESESFLDTDPAVLTTPGRATFYLVRSVYDGALSEPSNRVGVFVLELAPGG